MRKEKSEWRYLEEWRLIEREMKINIETDFY
jgi:hypothetical protein